MARFDAEMAAVTVILDGAYENRLDEAANALKQNGLEVSSIDDNNSVVEGTCTVGAVNALKTLPMVKYVRVGMTWWADYPKGDPRDVLEPVIRPAEVSDAEQMIRHVHAVVEESPGCLLLQPGEFAMTADQERAMIQASASGGATSFQVCLVDDELVALCSVTRGAHRATQHAGSIGMSVRKAWQRRGLGKQLLQSVIDRTREGGLIRRLDLRVFAENTPAISLYEKLGFVREGVRRQAAKINDRYLDELEMALVW